MSSCCASGVGRAMNNPAITRMPSPTNRNSFFIHYLLLLFKKLVLFDSNLCCCIC
uniref:Uncharacterized protein n=1 Tax=uncultured marine virus TaxID=186617 RepID=A0A0F7L369_9VIRU|nr:hypothetical protein [uncultured marine virus]